MFSCNLLRANKATIFLFIAFFLNTYFQSKTDQKKKKKNECFMDMLKGIIDYQRWCREQHFQ